MTQPFGPVMDGYFINDQLYDSIKSNKISKPIIFENAIHDGEKIVEIGFEAIRESLLLGHDESTLGNWMKFHKNSHQLNAYFSYKTAVVGFHAAFAW